MSTDQLTKQPVIKIIDTYRSKSSNKSNKDLIDTLIFKIKPQGSKSQLLVTYGDTKKNFPYSLIQFYEKKLQTKIHKTSQIQCEQKQKQMIIPERKTRNSQIKYPQTSKNLFLSSQQKNKDKKQQLKPIFDYDEQIRQQNIIQKKFVCVFQSQQQFQNPYIKQLAEYQGYQFPKKSIYCEDDSDSIHSKRKKKTKY